MKQETFDKRIEMGNLTTDDKYVACKFCSSLACLIKYSGTLKVYDNRLLNKDETMFIEPMSLLSILKALHLKYNRNFDTINGIAEYYTLIPAVETRKVRGLTFKSEQTKKNHEAFQRDLLKSEIVNTYKAEFENAKDYLYYGYSFSTWRKANNNPSDEEAKIIWDEAIKNMCRD